MICFIDSLLFTAASYEYCLIPYQYVKSANSSPGVHHTPHKYRPGTPHPWPVSQQRFTFFSAHGHRGVMISRKSKKILLCAILRKLSKRFPIFSFQKRLQLLNQILQLIYTASVKVLLYEFTLGFICRLAAQLLQMLF